MVDLVAILSFISFFLSFFTRIPQIIRIIKLKSSRGINQTSLLLETWNLTCSVSYSFYFSLPYIEYSSLLIQTLVLLTLTIWFSPTYRPKVVRRTFIIIFVELALHFFVLMGLTSSWVPIFFMVSSLPLSPLSRILQILRVKSLGPGSLSSLSYSLQSICTLCRLLCVLMVSRDKLMLLKLTTMTLCNSALAILIVKLRKRSNFHND